MLPCLNSLISLSLFFAVTLLSAYLSDKYNARAIPTMVVATLAIAGFSIYLGKEDYSFPWNLNKNEPCSFDTQVHTR